MSRLPDVANPTLKLVPEANAPERLGAVVVFDEARDKLSRLEVVYSNPE
jgi:hypothetical protein